MIGRLIVGRSVAQTGPLSEAIAAAGFTALYQPMLRIVTQTPPDDFDARLSAAQAVVVTSANAVRRLAEFTRKRFVQVLAVGDATAMVARSAGFVDTHSAQGDVRALAALCRRRLRPEGGKVLYLRAREVAGDLTAELGAAGFAVDEIVAYAAEPATALRPRLDAALRVASIDGVLLFSARSAAIFASLVRQAGLENACAGVVLLALSQNVAEATGDLLWRSRLVPAAPSGKALLETLTGWRDGTIAV
ncbi:MAG: uroporphyrinogen-III synthase [Reyranellaceae bacterium]